MTDDKGDLTWQAKEIARWIKRGLTVEHVSSDYVRANFTTHCPHEPVQPALFDMKERE